jgi:acetylornithine aminotransferase
MNETLAEQPLTLERESELFFHTYARLPIEISHGEGNYLFAKDGRQYLDMIAGIGVNALGYGNERVLQAITEQAKKVIHTSNLFMLEPQFKLAEKLLALTGFSKVFFLQQWRRSQRRRNETRSQVGIFNFG